MGEGGGLVVGAPWELPVQAALITARATAASAVLRALKSRPPSGEDMWPPVPEPCSRLAPRLSTAIGTDGA